MFHLALLVLLRSTQFARRGVALRTSLVWQRRQKIWDYLFFRVRTTRRTRRQRQQRRRQQRQPRVWGQQGRQRSRARFGTKVWLCRDRPKFATEELTRLDWPSPPGAYHVQHWFALEAEAELALYEGRAIEALAAHASDFRALRRSLLLRLQMMRSFSRWLRARLLVAGAKQADDARQARSWRKEAAKLCRKLEREKVVSYPKVFAACVRPALSLQDGNEKGAIQELRDAIAISLEHNMLFHVAGARYRLGTLLGAETAEGKGLLAQARAYCEAQGVKDPPRMFETVIPGF